MVYFMVFLLSAIVTLMITPLVRSLALQNGILDRPGGRRIHQSPIPLLGGLAIYLGFMISIIIAAGIDLRLLGLFAGGALILVIGICDDLYELSPLSKLLGELAAASLLVISGYRIEFVTNPLGGGMIYLSFMSIPVTLLWIVVFCNLINLIDGLDGLAAGITMIAAVVMTIVGGMKGRALVAVMAAALSGACLGFLKYNFNPARIFMGDGGALFLGYMLGSISVLGALKGAATIALTVPMIALGMPIADTAFAVVRRIKRGVPFYIGDRHHIHHRLMEKGLSQRKAVLWFYIITGILGACAVILSVLSASGSGFLFIGMSMLLVLTLKGLGLFEANADRDR